MAESEDIVDSALDTMADADKRDIDWRALQAKRTEAHTKQLYYVTSVVSHSGLTPFSGAFDISATLVGECALLSY